MSIATILMVSTVSAQYSSGEEIAAQNVAAHFIAPSSSRLALLHDTLKAPTVFNDTLRNQISDKDKDGIPDSLDKCPDEKGVKEYDGCPIPDSDDDGISDDLDNCPTIKGLPKNNGCPPGDKDGDKVNDDEDKCPDIPGAARFGGCPLSDTDGDGVNDDDDKCIDIPGSKNNFGCPETKESRKAAKKAKRKKSNDRLY